MLAANVHYSCYTEHDRYGLSCMPVCRNCEQCWVCMVFWSLSFIVDWIIASLEEGSGQESLEQRSVSTAV